MNHLQLFSPVYDDRVETSSLPLILSFFRLLWDPVL